MLNLVLDESFIDKKWIDKLDAICKIAGTKKEAIVISKLVDFMSDFCDKNGEFAPKKAVLYQNISPGGERKEMGCCYVLDEITVVGHPYYKIYYHGTMMRVPQYCVKILSKE